MMEIKILGMDVVPPALWKKGTSASPDLIPSMPAPRQSAGTEELNGQSRNATTLTTSMATAAISFARLKKALLAIRKVELAGEPRLAEIASLIQVKNVMMGTRFLGMAAILSAKLKLSLLQKTILV